MLWSALFLYFTIKNNLHLFSVGVFPHKTKKFLIFDVVALLSDIKNSAPFGNQFLRNGIVNIFFSVVMNIKIKRF